jgi:hypothetical protein
VGHTLFLTGEASQILVGSTKCEVFNEVDPGTFLMCNISQSFPHCSLSNSFLFELFRNFAEAMLPPYASGA